MERQIEHIGRAKGKTQRRRSRAALSAPSERRAEWKPSPAPSADTGSVAAMSRPKVGTSQVLMHHAAPSASAMAASVGATGRQRPAIARAEFTSETQQPISKTTMAGR